jgi:hypothetical protein
MQVFLADQDIRVTFDLTELELEPTSVEYRVVDGDDVELIAQTIAGDFVVGSGEYVLTVPAANNQVAPVAPYDGRTFVPATAARTVYLWVTGTGAASGTVLLQQHYLLTLEDRLLVPQSSFQTLAGAEQVALDLVQIDAWEAASERDKIGALMQARDHIASMSFRFKPEDWQSRVMPVTSLHDFAFMTADEWATMDANFKRDLKRAQVIEAAHILEADEHENAREQGIVSKTVGESSTTYRQTRRAQMPLCDRAMRVLAKYISAPRIGRA